jgi:predicted Zn-dependent protease
MKRTIVRAGLLLLTAAPLAAQQQAIATRVAGQLGGKFTDATCQLKEGHFLVSSAKTKLSSYSTTADPVIGARLLRESVGVLIDAITTKGQQKNGAAWYWLGRTNLLQGDLAGADSVLTKAEAQAPQCKADIRSYRTRAWAAVVVAAQGALEAKQTDSAEFFYHAANQIEQEAPHAYNGLAGIFFDRQQSDSAIHYFGLAAATNPTDPAYAKIRNRAAYNHAALLLNARRAPEAVTAFRRFLSLEPGDDQGRKGLAQAFRAAGMADSAQVIERELLAAGNAGGDDGLSDTEIFDLATRQYNDKNYAEAATTYARLLSRSPYHRDALFAQANSYLATQNGPGLIGAATKLVEIDPLGEYNYQLLAQGYKFEKKQDKLAEVIIAEYALPVDLQLEGFEATADTATFRAKAVGREPRDESNKVLPPRPITIVVECLAKDGTVVGAQESTIRALKPGESDSVQVRVTATGARAWRYRIK